MINISVSELNFLIYIMSLAFVVSIPLGFIIGLINIFRCGFKEGKNFAVIALEHERYLFLCCIIFLIYVLSYLVAKINLVP